MSKLKIGDEVAHKAGTTKMVIEEIKENQAKCVWQDDKGNVHERQFPLETLKSYEAGGIYFPPTN